MPAAPTTLEIVSLLQNLRLLADVSEADLRALAGICRVDHLEKDAQVFLQGDPADRIWIVHEGRVKIVYQEEDGRDMILEIISAGEPFGGAVLFFPAHPATAKTMQPATLVSFASDAYRTFLTRHPGVAVRLIGMLGQRHYSMLSMQALTGERTERRMAHILLKLASRAGVPDEEGTLITLSLSRQDLADMTGTTLETAIRLCSRFHARGLMSTRQGGHIVIHDEERLRQMAQAGGG